jgi:hypothetical protein
MHRKLTIIALAATLALSFSGAGIAGPREEQLDKYASAAKARILLIPHFPDFPPSAARPCTPRPSPAARPTPRPAPLATARTRVGLAATLPARPSRPMALSVSPARYTDPAKVEKWFKRNCNEVLGRECTPQEKGDWLSFMIGQ